MNIFKLCLKHKAKITFGTLPNGDLMVTVVADRAVCQQQLTEGSIENTTNETQLAFLENLIEQCKKKASEQDDSE